MEYSFSNRLFLVPLFQGFSRLDFLDIVEKTPFSFQSLKPREVLVRQNEECRSLCMVLGGEVECEVDSPDHTYRFCERLTAPWVVHPECLFGLHNRYSCTVRAASEAQIVMLDKQSVRQLLLKYPVFQINFYNTISTFAQNAVWLLWQTRRMTIEERFRTFMQRRSLRPFGKKMLYIRMEDLAMELGTTRLRVSQMLSELSSRNLVTYSRGVVTIDALEKL